MNNVLPSRTWENSRMGESIIRDLESQGLQLNKEKQSYVGKD
jgi:hypothetical protein